MSGALAQILYYGSAFLLIWIMVSHFKTLNGWTAYEVMLLLTLNLLSYSLCACFLFLPFVNLSASIQSGEFDLVCIKPINPFLFMITSQFNIGYLAHFILSITMLIVCFIKLNLSLSFLQIIFLISVLIGAGLIQGSFLMFLTIPAFWIVRNSSLPVLLFAELKNFIQYPISLYNRTIQILFTFVIPFAFINFYPAQYFIKKNDFLMFSPLLQFLTLPIGLLFFLLAYRFWLSGLNSYKSTGS